tara:strand:+ start:757 stop:972 length:216 start_codon:yes stop_codon:yes gene_type:complete
MFYLWLWMFLGSFLVGTITASLSLGDALGGDNSWVPDWVKIPAFYLFVVSLVFLPISFTGAVITGIFNLVT